MKKASPADLLRSARHEAIHTGLLHKAGHRLHAVGIGADGSGFTEWSAWWYLPERPQLYELSRTAASAYTGQTMNLPDRVALNRLRPYVEAAGAIWSVFCQEAEVYSAKWRLDHSAALDAFARILVRERELRDYQLNQLVTKLFPRYALV